MMFVSFARQELAGENGDEEPESSTTSHGGRHWIMVLSLASKMESVLFFFADIMQW